MTCGAASSVAIDEGEPVPKAGSKGGASNRRARTAQQWGVLTTVKLRGLPRKMSQAQVVDMLSKSGFDKTYDFVFLPGQPGSPFNRGHCFINFVRASFAVDFRRKFEGLVLDATKRARAEVHPSGIQGFQANYAQFLESPKFQADAMPLVLRDCPTQAPTPSAQCSTLDNLRAQGRATLAAATSTPHRVTQGHGSVCQATPSPAPGLVRRFCHECGHGREDKALFCGYCGTRWAKPALPVARNDASFIRS
eukprot:gb/GFBE01077429.1/.p1 GENE.gb/GFBE01077429.1/~~gb/GFBE01077429.1/.p1  ORF type:complete len:250 (+),score=44.31 gb/GFBE01077429.1/:1-750(+)